MKKSSEKEFLPRLNISDEDAYEAMKEAGGFLDITPGGFKELYGLAYRHALKRMLSVRAEDIMTREVHTVAPGTPLRDVADIMAEKGVAGLPVVDAERRVKGVISEKDFLSLLGAKGGPRSFMAIVASCLKGKGCAAIPARAGNASDIMSSPAITVGPGATLMEVAEIFAERGINRVPVVDAEGRLMGIVSRADIVRALTLRKG